ncbi:MAG TPA: TIGR02757 family protein [bacterium]|nr:TIGR02757 family protein [Myxococcales bacterium]OQA61209.1 MAG: hypothetical protein BWY40_00648 [bacterium ADurb.Bin270]HPW46059.1 TIGR02757 family protein [bacterium]HQG13503.1 TIGR02757 family protein [bacterium]HQH80553.1 TIGR02757 family protein [bacterium]
MSMISKKDLDELYCRLNRREYVSPDPLQFLYNYSEGVDREIVALIASSLAYGRVAQILKSVEKVLNLVKNPSNFIENNNFKSMRMLFKDFKHRFTTGDEIASMLFAVKGAVERFGSLEGCFCDGFSASAADISAAMAKFVDNMNKLAEKPLGYLLPSPISGSACKRLNLFARWMVRCDEVDPGFWRGIPPSKLIIPLDTHMYRICSSIGFTSRKSADFKTAAEITASLREFSPEDPVKYDFSLTRLGIRSDMDPSSFIAKFSSGETNGTYSKKKAF